MATCGDYSQQNAKSKCLTKGAFPNAGGTPFLPRIGYNPPFKRDPPKRVPPIFGKTHAQLAV